ncbi:P-loop containing nucleoside triphosphate hydrolase protein [Cladorrhinum sp. PSN332]|nr:P-loop containing nucleoside triphosphate hydrolase protein [Cladorrhinum sp. PSN332]
MQFWYSLQKAVKQQIMVKKNFYAIARGRAPGIYTVWADAEKQVKGFAGQCFKGFVTREEAEAFMRANSAGPSGVLTNQSARDISASKRNIDSADSADEKRRKTASDLNGIEVENGAVVEWEGVEDDITTSEAQNQPPLCDEQQHVVDLAAQGKNIYCTGSAGTGKSTVLRAIRERLQDAGKEVHVVSPTGIVAVQINGTTIFHFAGWIPDDGKKHVKELVLPEYPEDEDGKLKKKKQRKLELLSRVDVIIIDEISMVQNNDFERLDFLMREAKNRDRRFTGRARKLPFGGVQVIVMGDFYQLPPVKPFRNCGTCGRELQTDNKFQEWPRRCVPCGRQHYERDKYAFRSQVWRQCDFENIVLKKIHRQSDEQFVSLLQKCRRGIKFETHEIALLEADKPSIDDRVIKLFPDKKTVRIINKEAFEKIDAEPVFYPCLDKFFKVNDAHDPDGRFSCVIRDDSEKSGTLMALRDHRWDPKLYLKEGMRVMLLHNLDIEDGLCNGTQGEVCGFEARHENGLAANLGAVYSEARGNLTRWFADICRASDDFLGWPVVRFDNGKMRTIYPECTVTEIGPRKPYSLLCRAQVPLTAGYALSIHKSQGMTLENVVVDLENAFCHEQIYVSLSRAKTLEGLKVVGLGEAQVKTFRTDPTCIKKVKEFYDSIAGSGGAE